MRALRTLALAGTLTTIVAAFMGSYVRGKGAGLSCPDWPLCYGQIVPEFDQWIFLEWFHRTIVFCLSLLVAGAATMVWWKRLQERWLALLTVVMLVVQAVMGGLTVLLKTHPVIVALHQGMAFVFFACLVTLTVRIYYYPLPAKAARARQPVPAGVVS